MMQWELLEQIEFHPEEIACVRQTENRFGEAVEALAQKYMCEGERCPEPYPVDGRMQALQRATDAMEHAAALDPQRQNDRVLGLLFWLHCIPYAEKLYEKFAISREIFRDTMMDITYKMRECRQLYGQCGVFTPWIFLVFDLKVFALGRLQFEIRALDREIPAGNGQVLPKGTRVCSCHIPASGKLTREQCMASFSQAGTFFASAVQEGILPIICDSWMLYPPYIRNVFPENSNLQMFAGLFQVYDRLSTGQDFSDGWRVFGKSDTENVQDLPHNTTLQRNFIRYIQNGGDFGYGLGLRMHRVTE